MLQPGKLRQIEGCRFSTESLSGWTLRICLLLPAALAFALPVTGEDTRQRAATANALYQLGPEDVLLVHVKDEPEIPDGPYAVDLEGNLTLPELGTIPAQGLSVAALREVITKRCQGLLKQPIVNVSITEYRSQKIEILGAVVTPSVQQVRGRKTLYEVISEAGGLKPEAGGTIQLTRSVAQGPIPLPDAHPDPSGQFEIANIDVEELMKARTPSVNIAVRPNDVITVPKAELVYVLGAVRRPGGFTVSEKKSISALQALSLAEGVERTASLKHARVLRRSTPGGTSTDTPIDLSKLMAGKVPDFELQANDILIVPTSSAKSAMFRTLEAAVNTGSGVAIYHPF